MNRRKLRLRAALVILLAAFASFVLSVVLWFTGNENQGIFVGLWVPSILAFGAVALQIVGDRNE
jgi:hypothetical protein